ncbi:MAG: VOC family protein [Methanobacterium sp.]
MDNGYLWLEVKPSGAETTTDDMKSTYKDLNVKGVKFIEEPKIQEWGVMQAIFADLDDNRFVLVERD